MPQWLRELLNQADAQPGRTDWDEVRAGCEQFLGWPFESTFPVWHQLQSPRVRMWQSHARQPWDRLILALRTPTSDATFRRHAGVIAERMQRPVPTASVWIVVEGGTLTGVLQEREGQVGQALAGARPDLVVRELEPEPVARPVRALDPPGLADQLEAALTLPRPEWPAVVAALFGDLEAAQVADIQRAGGNPDLLREPFWQGKKIDPARGHRLGLFVVTGADSDPEQRLDCAMERMLGPENYVQPTSVLVVGRDEAGAWSHARLLTSSPDETERLRLISAGFQPGLPWAQVAQVGAIGQPNQDGANLYPDLRRRDAEDAYQIRRELTVQARRRHNRITNRLLEWARARDVRATEGNRANMFDVLFEAPSGARLLFEVKSTADLGTLRLAVGQLLDYRLRLGGADDLRCVVFLPEERIPPPEIRAVLEHLGFWWGRFRHDQIEIRSGGDVVRL